MAFSTKLLDSFLPRNDIIIISCDSFNRCNSFSKISYQRNSNLFKITTSLRDSHSDEPDEDGEGGGGGKKRHRVSTWKKWVVGISLSILLPSYRRKLGPLAILRDRVNEVIETTETVTEVVEDVASGMKNLAEELERRLPAKNADGKVKEALDLVEKIAEGTIKIADSAQELIDKVEEAGELLEDALAIAEARKEKEKDASPDNH